MSSVACPPPEDPLLVVVQLLGSALRRALARAHGYNESVHPGESRSAVASGEQTGISADTPAPGAQETA